MLSRSLAVAFVVWWMVIAVPSLYRARGVTQGSEARRVVEGSGGKRRCVQFDRMDRSIARHTFVTYQRRAAPRVRYFCVASWGRRAYGGATTRVMAVDDGQSGRTGRLSWLLGYEGPCVVIDLVAMPGFQLLCPALYSTAAYMGEATYFSSRCIISLQAPCTMGSSFHSIVGSVLS